MNYENNVSRDNNKWETPQNLFDELNNEFNFTLDPCCNEETKKCDKYYTEKEDGLKQDWSKDIVFMNPPYGYNTNVWIKKAYEESEKGATVVCLIPARTDTGYWHDYIFKYAKQIRFIRGKVKFGGSKWTAPFASAIVIFSPKNFNEKIIYYKESINARNKGNKVLC